MLSGGGGGGVHSFEQEEHVPYLQNTVMVTMLQC